MIERKNLFLTKQQFLKRLGNNVKNARNDSGMTQLDLSKEAKINYRHLQKIEAGQVDIKLSTLYVLSKSLKEVPANLLK